MKRRLVLAAAVVMVLGLVAGGVVALRWRASYEPLAVVAENVALGDRLAAGVEHPGGTISDVTIHGLEPLEPLDEPGPTPSDSDDDATVVTTPYADGQGIVYAVTLRNDGNVGVTIAGFELHEPSQHSLLRTDSVRLGKKLRAGGSSVTSTEAPRPFALRAGEERTVVFRATVGDCEWYQPGSASVQSGIGVRYRVLGLRRTARLSLPVHVHVPSPPADQCPRPAQYTQHAPTDVRTPVPHVAPQHTP